VLFYRPRFWGGITPFMQNVVRRVWNCCSLRNKSTQKGQVKKFMVGKILKMQQLMQKA
jgi:hypothetical protein